MNNTTYTEPLIPDNIEELHHELVLRLVKDGQAILDQQTPLKAHLEHMAIGVCGEAGELADAIKKHAIYNKGLDLANVVEELGDLEFFMRGIRTALNLTREETLAHNIKKLNSRYHTAKYEDSHAQERKDKVQP